MPKVDRPWQPGDVIVSPLGRRRVVLDPPLTSRGKLRMQSESGAYVTAWWRDHLPQGHYREVEPEP